MDNYISREAAKAAVRKKYSSLADRCEINEMLNTLHGIVIVHCKDCKYYAINHLTKDYEPDKRYNPSVCIIGEFARRRKPDWFCADGERRESE